MSDYLIVGAGINGMLLARELAQAGAEVVLIDKSDAGSESSWAGGGIVSPLNPWRYSLPVSQLAIWSQQIYPQLTSDLIAESGIDPEYEVTGLLSFTRENEKEAFSWAAQNQCTLTKVDESFIYAKEPGLAAGFSSALWMPEVANVRNPRLCRALLKSLQSKSNVKIFEQCNLIDIQKRECNVSGAVVKREHSSVTERLVAGNYVVCSGAWTKDVLRTSGVEVEIHPVKGQMLLFKLKERMLSSIIVSNEHYLIPRRDGHVLAGSTTEFSKFDKTTTRAAKEELGSFAEDYLPALVDKQPCKHWAGLRPGTTDGVPYIGRVSPYENLFVNAGQFRNGLLLAPASARLLIDIMLGNSTNIDPAPFSLESRSGALA